MVNDLMKLSSYISDVHAADFIPYQLRAYGTGIWVHLELNGTMLTFIFIFLI
jgi:hypothetical protein